MRSRIVKKFLDAESSSALLLLFMAIFSMVWINSPLQFLHVQFIDLFLFWINEGLMAFFFLMVGLELKHGYLEGHLTQLSQMLLPAVAAVGGMLIPAFIYYVINFYSPATRIGWATPVATDIAFALGALSIFGKRVPKALTLFLLALAIFDDLGAVAIISFYHSQMMAVAPFIAILCMIFFLYLLNFFQVGQFRFYLLAGAGLWYGLMQAGLHPTMAGVMLALFIPEETRGGKKLLLAVKNALNPLVAYIIVPLFALANAGFPLHDLTLDIFKDEVILGIVFGLFIGKPIGVCGASWLLIKLKLSKLPAHTNWLQLGGVGLLCGIGFTMSLFLGTLSFAHAPHYLTEVRVGVICGSVLSALAGIIVLKIAFKWERS